MAIVSKLANWNHGVDGCHVIFITMSSPLRYLRFEKCLFSVYSLQQSQYGKPPQHTFGINSIKKVYIIYIFYGESLEIDIASVSV